MASFPRQGNELISAIDRCSLPRLSCHVDIVARRPKIHTPGSQHQVRMTGQQFNQLWRFEDYIVELNAQAMRSVIPV